MCLIWEQHFASHCHWNCLIELQVKDFLAGAGTDAPDVDDEEYMNSRPSVGYDDMWAKTILETYDAEVSIVTHAQCSLLHMLPTCVQIIKLE